MATLSNPLAVRLGETGFERLSSRVYRFVDVCNVYAVVDGSRALLVDFGTGRAMDHLASIGVEAVDWVLYTHHHRDVCQGDRLRRPAEARVAVPAREAPFFEDAERLWAARETYDIYDLADVFRAPTRQIPVTRRLEDYETFAWGGIELTAVPTPGHTRGAASYVGEVDGVRYAFCGDVIHAPGRVWQVHDLQWEYTRPDALNVAAHSARVLREARPDRLAPAHGVVCDAPEPALRQLEGNLARLFEVIVQRQPIAPTTAIVRPHCVQVSEHLYAATGPSANFYVLCSESGEVLLFDYGFPSMDHLIGAGCRFAEHSLDELRDRFGIDRVDVAIATHYHDDHVAGLNFLRERHGTEVWTLDIVADLLERPHAYCVPCLWGLPTPVARRLRDGERLIWNEFAFDVHHNPGHTWWAGLFLTELDGRRVAIVGDETLADGPGGLRGGGPIYRNRVRLRDFTDSLSRIRTFAPELLLTGHNGPVPVARTDLDHALGWAAELEAAWLALAADPREVEFALDPDPVRIDPYRSAAAPGSEIHLRAEIWNHHEHPAEARLAPVAPDGWGAEPAEACLPLQAGAVGHLEFTLSVPVGAALARGVVTFDVQLGELNLGEATEAIIDVAHHEDR
ncbi:MAG: MBL fold metallo-hydrolase [Acidimicrobiia bacterium]